MSVKLYNRNYWLSVIKLLKDRLYDDLVEEILIPQIYFSLEDYRFQVFQHIIRTINNRATRLGKNDFYKVLKMYVPSYVNDHPTRNVPRFKNHKSPIKVVSRWYRFIDELIKTLDYEELKLVMTKSSHKPFPLFVLEFFAWKKRSYIIKRKAKKKNKVLAHYSLKKDITKVKETWGAEEVDLTTVPSGSEVILTTKEDDEQVITEWSIALVNDHFPNETKREVILLGAINHNTDCYKVLRIDDIPEGLRLFRKPRVQMDTENFSCQWEGLHLDFELKPSDRVLGDRIFPWLTKLQDLILMTYSIDEKRSFMVFRILQKRSDFKWIVRGADHKEMEVNIYDFTRPLFYVLNSSFLQSKEEDFVKIDCLAIPPLMNESKLFHTFNIEFAKGCEAISEILIPRLVECTQMGWLGRSLICDDSMINIISFIIPIEGKDSLVRSMAKKISSLLPAGYYVANEATGFTTTDLVIELV